MVGWAHTENMTTTAVAASREEFYVFAGRDGRAWCEMFLADGYAVAPTPFRSVADAVAEIETRNPGAVVDWLDDDCVPVDVRRAETQGGIFR